MAGYNASVKRQTILAGSGIMMGAMLLSRLLGLVREKSLAFYWGRSPHTDAFWAAFMLPDLLYYLLAGGALGAAVIPVFAGYLQEKGSDEHWRVGNALLTLFGLCAALGAAIIVVFAHPLVRLVAPGFTKYHPAQAAESAGYVRIIAPMVFFTVFSALSTAMLQAHRHFTAPSFAWLAYNFGIIGGAFVGGLVVNRYVGDPAGLRAVAVGVVVGAVLLVVVQLPSLAARGFRLRPVLDLSHPGVKETVRLFLPYMAGLAFPQICLLWLPSFFGSYFPEGGITSLRYANRLVVLPLSLFGISISTAAFPAMAEQVAAGRMGEFRRLISGSLRAVMFLAIPSAAGIFVLADPIVRLLWRGGAFHEGDVAASTFCLVFYTVSLIGLSGLQIINRAFYSLRDTRTPPLIGIGYSVLVVVIAIGLMRTSLQYAAIAAATSVGTMVGFLLMVAILRQRLGGLDGRTIALSVVRITIASVVMALVAMIVSKWSGAILGAPATRFMLTAPANTLSIGRPVPTSHVGMQVMLSMAAGIVAYVVALFLLRAPEVRETYDTIRRRGARASATTN
jgi:putative peptidoglycan lipid II flippase